MQQWIHGIKINKSNNSKAKNPIKRSAKSFWGYNPKKHDFFVAPIEAKNQHDTSYSFRVFSVKNI